MARVWRRDTLHYRGLPIDGGDREPTVRRRPAGLARRRRPIHCPPTCRPCTSEAADTLPPTCRPCTSEAADILPPMTTPAPEPAEPSPDVRPSTARVDADIHNVVPSTEALFPYLSDHWRETVTQTLFKGTVDSSYPPRAPISAREGSRPPEGPPGSSLPLLREQVLDPDGVERGILTCTYAIDALRN